MARMIEEGWVLLKRVEGFFFSFFFFGFPREVRVGSPPSGVGVGGAGVADQDGFLVQLVASLGSGGTGVDGVFVVEAATDGVEFDELDAHGGVEGGCGAERRVCRMMGRMEEAMGGWG
jgi:hypothetical protein